MRPKKRVADISRIHSEEQEEEWQPQGFQQLPQGLVMDILSRLSVKTLFNCRCVCKSWVCIISDPHFYHLRVSRLPMGMGILIKTNPEERKSEVLDFTQIDESAGSQLPLLEKLRFSSKYSLPPISEFKLINSCNGLLLLCGELDLPNRDGSFSLCVCNPILGEYITLPVPPPNSDRTLCCYSFLGLGYSVATQEYKVVLQTSSCGIAEAQIYTIGTRAWRSIGKAPSGIVKLELAPFDALLHGALHWLSQASDSIHSFNFETELFRTLSPPGCLEEKNTKCLKLGVLDGCLFLCVSGDNHGHFDFWVMKDYGVQESWTKTLVFENFYLLEHYIVHEPLVLLRNGDFILLGYGRVVVCYNRETKSVTEAMFAPTLSYFHTLTYFHAIGYNPCFVSLHDVAKGEKVERVRDENKSLKLFGEGSSDQAGSRMPPHKSAKLDSGYGLPAS